MADNNIMEININLSTADIVSKQEEQLNTVTAPLRSNNNNDNSKTLTDTAILKKAVGVSMAIGQIQQMSSQIITSKLSQIGTLYDDQATQNKINNMIDASSKATGLAQSTIGGALVGGAPGAVIMGISALMNEVYQGYERNMNYQRKQAENAITSVRSAESLGRISSDNNR